MKFGLWTAYGALNSKPVFESLKQGLQKLGHSIIENKEGDINVIWSLLWNGRMARNKPIYDKSIKQKIPIIIVEVGGLKRMQTWKIGLNGINRDAYFGPTGNDNGRAKKLNIELRPWNLNGEKIVIACQHHLSGQWKESDQYKSWLISTIEDIRKRSDKKIIIRPHPRDRNIPISISNYKNVQIEIPKKIPDTYDDFNLNFDNTFAVFNYSSNPGVQACMSGISAFVSESSLAYDVANKHVDKITQPELFERQQWLNDLVYTEWTTEEITTGFPINRLTNHL